jgi:hypothetical protein
MMRLKMTLAVAALLTIGLSSAAAYADTVNFTLVSPAATAMESGNTLVPGTFTFEATVTAPSSNSGAVFLNGDSFNVTAPITLDDSDFFANFPLSLAPGASFTGDLFVLTVPPGTLAAAYTGTFTLFGGANANANDPLGTVTFSVAPTPEPSSVVLLMTSLGALALWVGYKRNLLGSVR